MHTAGVVAVALVTAGFAGSAGGSLAPPPQQVCNLFPPAQDAFPSAFQFVAEMPSPTPFGRISVNAFQPGGLVPVAVAGYDQGMNTIVQRGASYCDLETGLTIDTEMVQLNLQGTHPSLGPWFVTLNPGLPSKGKVYNIQADHRTGEFLGGQSYFHVFFQLRMPQNPACQVVGNPQDDPFEVEATLTQLPPTGPNNPGDNEYIHRLYRLVQLLCLAGAAPFGLQYYLANAVGGGHKPLPPPPCPGCPVPEQHGILLTARGAKDLSEADCYQGVVEVRMSDASSPPHIISGASTLAAPPAMVSLPPGWADSGGGIWLLRIASASGACESITVDVRGSFTDGDKADNSITVRVRA